MFKNSLFFLAVSAFFFSGCSDDAVNFVKKSKMIRYQDSVYEMFEIGFDKTMWSSKVYNGYKIVVFEGLVNHRLNLELINNNINFVKFWLEKNKEFQKLIKEKQIKYIKSGRADQLDQMRLEILSLIDALNGEKKRQAEFSDKIKRINSEIQKLQSRLSTMPASVDYWEKIKEHEGLKFAVKNFIPEGTKVKIEWIVQKDFSNIVIRKITCSFSDELVSDSGIFFKELIKIENNNLGSF
ncbi:MAG: hypothetical protein RBR08_03075 [Desulforegulaceae bacterium]|nr:hypothetical protein [Desulforegulaceae bacterium]